MTTREVIVKLKFDDENWADYSDVSDELLVEETLEGFILYSGLSYEIVKTNIDG